MASSPMARIGKPPAADSRFMKWVTSTGISSRRSASDDITEAVTADLLPTDLGASVGGTKGGDLVISLPLREAREIFERDYLMAQINRFGGNISRTAAFIGMERSALHRKLKSLGVGSAQSFPN